MFCYSELTKIIGNCAAYELIFRYRIRFCLYYMEQLKGIPKIACVCNEMSAGKQLISSFEYSISYICYAGIPFFESFQSTVSCLYLTFYFWYMIVFLRWDIMSVVVFCYHLMYIFGTFLFESSKPISIIVLKSLSFYYTPILLPWPR